MACLGPVAHSVEIADRAVCAHRIASAVSTWAASTASPDRPRMKSTFDSHYGRLEVDGLVRCQQIGRKQRGHSQ
jgi:hypothetical protein